MVINNFGSCLTSKPNDVWKDTIALPGPPSSLLGYSTTLFHTNQEHRKLPGADAELPFFVTITRCQCVPSPPGTARLWWRPPVTNGFLQVPCQDTPLTMVLWDHSGPALPLSPCDTPHACTSAQGGTAGSCFLSSPRAAATSVSCARTLDTG